MMSLVPSTLLALAALPSAPVPQESAPEAIRTVSDDRASSDRPAGESGSVEESAETLRARIRDMRMNLLLGGDQVRSAEREASAFYQRKSQSVDRRIDDVATELTELRATYDVALDRALDGRGTQAGAEALAEAQPLRARIDRLEGEMDRLDERRGRLSELVAAVGERDRERRQLVDQLEAQSVDAMDFGGGMPILGIGLAPNVPIEASAPLDDDALLADLMARDPRGTRAMLYAADPAAYWERFPLRPPAAALRRALVFPKPDPVGRR